MKHAQRSILPLLILAIAAPLRAADRQLIGSLFEKAYKGKNMVLRTFNSGATVRYSPDGRLIKGGQPGPWTLDADIRCTGVEFKRKDLVIKGQRLYFLYDKTLQALRPYLGPDINVEIAIAHDSPSLSALQQAIAEVFVTGTENPVLLMPDYWKDCLLHPTRHATAPPPGQMSAVPSASTQKSASSVTSIHEAKPAADAGEKQDVTPPRPIYKPEPAYTHEARIAHVEGIVLLSIEIDATGRVTKESIITPLGMGLDDNAAQTIQTWRFKPSLVDGKPVPVRTDVEVYFQLR